VDIGRRVKAAREILDYTQDDLGKAVGLNREAILNIEKGKRKAKADELWRIAGELQQPILYFLEDMPGQDLAVAVWRGDASATRDVKRAELWLSQHFDDYEQLLRILKRRGNPKVCLEWAAEGRVVDQARRAAQVQRRCHKLGGRPVADLREHLEDDVRVPVFGRAVLDTDFCGMLLLEHGSSAAAMLVNAELVTSRRNFTMAHEYGHLLWKLRRQEPAADVFYRHADENEEEMFANAFAAHFLAPDNSVRENTTELKVSARNPDSVMQLAAEYGVSFQMITYRLQNLGLLSAEESEALRATVRPTGLAAYRWERQAFYALSPLYWGLILEAYTTDELDAARCAEMVDMSALEFEDLIADLDEELIGEEALLEAAS